MLEDIKYNTNGKMIALTLSNESISELQKLINPKFKGYERDNAIITIAIRRFLERYRKEHGTSLRHWLVTELGHKGTENIHAHGIIWTESTHNIPKLWKYGFVWRGYIINGKLINYVNERTINYTVKYLHKRDNLHKGYRPKMFTSPGMGKGYLQSNDAKLNKFNESKTKQTYTTRTGHEIMLPPYLRNKIYTDEEREALWLHAMDKGIKYICGDKVDQYYNLHQMWNLQDWHRERNKELGFGSNKPDTSRLKYEEERREIIINHRINNAKKNYSDEELIQQIKLSMKQRLRREV